MALVCVPIPSLILLSHLQLFTCKNRTYQLVLSLVSLSETNAMVYIHVSQLASELLVGMVSDQNTSNLVVTSLYIILGMMSKGLRFKLSNSESFSLLLRWSICLLRR